jgi:hypothetical protein
MPKWHKHPQNPKEKIFGTRLLFTFIMVGDMYSARNGKWESATSEVIGTLAGTDHDIRWVRPKEGTNG